MSGAFESTLLRPTRSSNKLWMETGFGVNNGFERYRNSEYPVSDGATSNRAQIYGPFDAVNNPREWVAGAASLTIAAVVTVPTSVLGSVIDLCTYTSTTTVNSGGYTETNTLRINLFSNFLDIYQLGTSTLNTRRFNYGTFRLDYSGRTIFLKITLTQGTTNPVVEVNGVNISASFAASTQGTPPAWLDAAMVPTYRLVGYNWPSGPAPIVTPILGTTSAADDAFYMATGKWPAWVVRGGHTTNLLSAANSGFAGSVTDWSIYNGTTTLDSNTTVAGKLYWAFNSAATLQRIACANTTTPVPGIPSFPNSGLNYGSKYLVTLKARLASGTAQEIRIGYGQSAAATNFAITPTATESSYSGVIEIGNNTVFQLTSSLNTGNGSAYEFDDIVVQQIGALSLPSIQPINVVDDVSGIGTNCGLILGAATTATSNKKVWRIADLTKTSGNEQLLGGAVFVGTSQDYIKSWTIVNAGGTTTVSLGNVSGGAQYVSGLSVPTGTTVVTLLSNVPLTTNLWCNANTTASLTHIIEGYRTV